MAKVRALDADDAATLALEALAYLAGDDLRLNRFLALTGIDPGDLRDRAQDPEIQAAVLEHLLTDESLLLVFCAETGHRPEAIAPAYSVLAGGGDAW